MDLRLEHQNSKQEDFGFMDPKLMLTTIVILLMIRYLVKFCFTKKVSVEVILVNNKIK